MSGVDIRISLSGLTHRCWQAISIAALTLTLGALLSTVNAAPPSLPASSIFLNPLQVAILRWYPANQTGQKFTFSTICAPVTDSFNRFRGRP